MPDKPEDSKVEVKKLMLLICCIYYLGEKGRLNMPAKPYMSDTYSSVATITWMLKCHCVIYGSKQFDYFARIDAAETHIEEDSNLLIFFCLQEARETKIGIMIGFSVEVYTLSTALISDHDCLGTVNPPIQP